jgi:hypothetical protein
LGVDGQQRFFRIAAELPDLIDRELTKEIRDGFKDPVKQFKTAVDEEIRSVMPARYAGVFGGAFKVRQSGTGLDLKLKGSARGKAANRDSKARDEGSLKHPVFGRHRRTRRGRKANPWVNQRIRPGFWSRPAKDLAADLEKALEPIAEKAAKRVEKQL